MKADENHIPDGNLEVKETPPKVDPKKLLQLADDQRTRYYNVADIALNELYEAAEKGSQRALECLRDLAERALDCAGREHMDTSNGKIALIGPVIPEAELVAEPVHDSEVIF